MAYKPDPFSPVRDKTYPSEIAAQRPMCAPRIHCEQTYEERRNESNSTVRGDQGHTEYPLVPRPPGPREGDITEDRSAEFNRRLREG
jgi:hypothetical protein